MAEPITTTAVSAAASTATATGTSVGASSATAAAASTGTVTATSGAVATGSSPSLGPVAATGTTPSAVVPTGGAAGAGGKGLPVGGSPSGLLMQKIEFGPALIKGDPGKAAASGGRIIEFDPALIKADPASSPPSSSSRAMATEPVRTPDVQQPAPTPALPNPETRAGSQQPVSRPAEPTQDPALPLTRAPNDQLIDACHEAGPLDKGRHLPRGIRPDPLDPHERERITLNDLLQQLPSLPEEEQERVVERARIWEWRDKQKYPDATDVIGPYGHAPRYIYEKEKERQIREREREAQKRIGENIVNNPLAGSVSLYVLEETGDPEKAAAAGEPFQALTAGGGKGTPAKGAKAPRTPAAPRPSTRRGSASSKGKGTPTRKPPPKRSVPGPRKLTRQDRIYMREVRRLAEGLDARKTIAIIIVEKNGKQEALIASSLPKLPPSVEKAARGRYRFVRGTGNRPGNPKDKNDPEYTSYHHAEHAGISAALSSGYKVIAVYPSKPACAHCGGFRDLGFTVIDP